MKAEKREPESDSDEEERLEAKRLELTAKLEIKKEQISQIRQQTADVQRQCADQIKELRAWIFELATASEATGDSDVRLLLSILADNERMMRDLANLRIEASDDERLIKSERLHGRDEITDLLCSLVRERLEAIVGTEDDTGDEEGEEDESEDADWWKQQ